MIQSSRLCSYQNVYKSTDAPGVPGPGALSTLSTKLKHHNNISFCVCRHLYILKVSDLEVSLADLRGPTLYINTFFGATTLPFPTWSLALER